MSLLFKRKRNQSQTRIRSVEVSIRKFFKFYDESKFIISDNPRNAAKTRGHKCQVIQNKWNESNKI